MIRFLVRATGFILLAGAFVTLVVDGTRSIAASRIMATALGAALERAAPAGPGLLQAWVERVGGATAWTRLAEPLLSLPLAPILLVLGLILVRLAAAPAEEVGYLARR